MGEERCCGCGEWGLLGGADENGKVIDHCERQAGKAHTIQKAILLLSNSPSETLTQYKGDLRRWPLGSFVHLFIYPGHSEQVQVPDVPLEKLQKQQGHNKQKSFLYGVYILEEGNRK